MVGDPLLGFELLLFRRFQQQPALWYEWRERLRTKAEVGEESDNSMSVCLLDGPTLLTLESLEKLGVGVSF